MRLKSRLFREWTVLSRQIRPRLFFCLALARLLPDFTLVSVRTRLYRWAGCDIGQGVSLLGPLVLIGAGDVASRLHIAEGAIIAPWVTFGLDGEIFVGRHVSISPRATLYTATHALGFGSRRMTLEVTAKPIRVEDGAWIGMQALVLPGVSVGQGSVVSAGAVVAQDVAPNTLVAGNPASMQQKLPFGNR